MAHGRGLYQRTRRGIRKDADDPDHAASRHPEVAVYDVKVSELRVKKGPVFADVVPVDELNGAPTVCIRPFNVYGKRGNRNLLYSGVISKFLERIRNGLPSIIYGDDGQTRDFIRVGDVVETVVLAIENNDAVGETFNCGTGRETFIRELAEMMISITGKT